MKKDGMVGSERGVVLVLVVFLMAALSLMGIAASNNVVIDTAISTNHLSSLQSFYVAESGLELGKLEVLRRLTMHDLATLSEVLNNTHPAIGLAFGTRTTFSGGEYSVTVANNPGEDEEAVDTDRTITVISTGTFRNSTSTVATTIRMLTVPKLPGAVTFSGSSPVTLSGKPLKISGYDYNLNDPASSPSGTIAARPGVALCGTPHDGDLSSQVRDTIRLWDVQGSADTATSGDLTEKSLDNYVEALKPYSSKAVDCNVADVVYINGDFSVDCKGGTGKGILIVDGSLEFLGDTGWNGLVVVRGGALRFHGKNVVRGGVVIGSIPSVSSSASGIGLYMLREEKAAILYSREAIAAANSGLSGKQGKWTVLSWQRIK
jgi:Tfp pilus assembly protein PilX